MEIQKTRLGVRHLANNLLPSQLIEAPEARLPGGRLRGLKIAELLIILLILGVAAFLIVPQFSSAHQQDRENMLKDQLRYLRTQIVVFKAQHRDVSPGYENGDPTENATEQAFLEQMCQHTNINGEVNSMTSQYFQYGPYLGQIPVNPINGLNTVAVIENNQPMPAADGATGWTYKPQTHEIIANARGADDFGTAYSHY